MKKQRIFGLDVIRSVAIIFVLFSHSRFFLIEFYPRLSALSIFGYFGVEIFFVLSGLLIGKILIKLTLKEWNMIDLLKFWIMRWMRTLPNYYLFLITYFILYSKIFSLKCFDVRYFFFVQNLYHPHPSFFPEAWSLSVEEWFYLLFPFFLFIITKKHKDPKKSFFVSTILFIFIFSFLRLFYVFFLNPVWDEGIRKVVICRLDSIPIGALFAWIDHYCPSLFKQRKIVFLGCLCLSVSVIFYFLNKDGSLFLKSFYFFLTDFFFAMFLPFFSKIESSPCSFANVFTYISKISYSIYLVNLSLVYIFLKNFLAVSSLNQSFFTLFLYWILTFSISSLIYKVWEEPIMEFRYKLFK